MAIKKWKNGDKGYEVQETIDQNFNYLSNYISKSILFLSSEERYMLPSEFLKNGVVVFDKNLNEYLEYYNGQWIKHSLSGYTKEILETDWIENKITILFREHKIYNPLVQLFIKTKNGYDIVDNGITIDSNFNITLYSDLTFPGKVMIK